MVTAHPMATKASDRANPALETALRTAVMEEALILHYQPVVRIEDQAIVGAEALLRWHDQVHGDVPPKVFIPLAEESGLIHALGDWVMRTAAVQCAAWHRTGLPLTVSVNVSGCQFDHEDLAQRISTIVRESDCKPAWVELEVTESRRLHDLESVKKLRKMGFSIAIDNFGTGNSSLSYLRHFPINTLKIDRSFIDLETETSTHDAAIVRAMIAMAHGLGLRVVAEGVATGQQFDFLRAVGCDCFQGFWISRALPADAFAEFCRSFPGAYKEWFESKFVPAWRKAGLPE
jgi:EAL domain-containing protein (putative c-di-GMP-specific phosphodiesterase class I)